MAVTRPGLPTDWDTDTEEITALRLLDIAGDDAETMANEAQANPTIADGSIGLAKLASGVLVPANITGLDDLLAAKAATGHTHDDRYYTESEVDALLAARLPRTIVVPVFAPKGNTNWSTFTAGGAALSAGGRLASTGAQNAAVSWDILLPAGTWTLSLVHLAQNSAGVYHAAIDAAALGTIDGYASATSWALGTITGIVVAASAVATLSLTMASKNGSSSSFTGGIAHLGLTRTA